MHFGNFRNPLGKDRKLKKVLECFRKTPGAFRQRSSNYDDRWQNAPDVFRNRKLKKVFEWFRKTPGAESEIEKSFGMIPENAMCIPSAVVKIWRPLTECTWCFPEGIRNFFLFPIFTDISRILPKWIILLLR